MRLVARRLAGICLLSLVAVSLRGQTAPALDSTLAPHREAMGGLSALDGVWRGQAWTLLPSGEKLSFTQTIRVGPFGEGALKLLEGRSYDTDGRLRSTNAEIISYNASTRAYSLRLYSEGKAGDVPITPGSGGFTLTYFDGKDTTRFTISVSNGTWSEIAERRSPGQEPVRFLELTLHRAGDTEWPAAGRAPQPTYEVYAVRYGTVPGFPTRALVAGADSSRRSDVAMTVWLLKGEGRTVLVDAGFYREEFLKAWKPADFQKPSDALDSMGVSPASVTDIIVSHIHWDHLDGADLFPNARIWIQRAEYEYYVGSQGEALQQAISPVDAAMLTRLRAAGRVHLVEGDAQAIIPGIRVFTGGRHTYASQYAAVNTSGGTVVIASDNVYLYENLDKHVPIGSTLDAGANLAAQDRMGELAASRSLIIPGHDPAVFERFPSIKRGVVRIAPAATQGRLPVIDMHLHAHALADYGGGSKVCLNTDEIEFPGVDPRQPITLDRVMTCRSPLQSAATDDAVMNESIALLQKHNIWAVTTGTPELVGAWRAAASGRIIPATSFATSRPGPRTPQAFRRLVAEGKVAVFAEIGAQYEGQSLSDRVFEPFFALAEELDIPVGVHLGEGPPGGAHVLGGGTPSRYRARLTSPLQLEEVLIRHPRLRLYVMHYGSPLVDEMIALLYSHPQVYVDIAQNDWGFPRAHFYGQLRRLIDAGFEKRIMWGSDQMIWPGTIEVALQTIEEAPFLSAEQKRDIFYNNAARFLRLGAADIARHHGAATP